MNDVQKSTERSPLDEYKARLEHFKKYYLLLVLLTALAVCMGIAIAVLVNLLIGVCLSVISACVYVYFSIDEAQKSLGIRFKNINGYVVISRLYDTLGGTAVVPERLIYADVREIGDGALDGEKNTELCELYIPKSVEKIGKDIFADGAHVTIKYEGSAEEWENIESRTDFCAHTLCFDCEYPQLPPKRKRKKTPQSNSTEENT